MRQQLLWLSGRKIHGIKKGWMEGKGAVPVSFILLEEEEGTDPDHSLGDQLGVFSFHSTLWVCFGVDEEPPGQLSPSGLGALR